jgi:type IV secretion system protein VirB8
MASVNANYRKVALFSADAAKTSYLHQMQVSNPESPLTLYPRTTIIDARVKSVSPLGPSTALVRFDTMRSDAGAQPKAIGSWVAVVRYRYSSAPMSVEDRFVNPLGFQVVSYRRDAEALAQAPDEATPTPSAPQTAGAIAPSAGYYPQARTPAVTGPVR